MAPGDAVRSVNGAGRELAWDGRHSRVGPVSATDRVTLTFPIGERTDVFYVEKHRYMLTRRGNDVVDIDPPGRCCPLYQRRRAPPVHGQPLRRQRERGLVAGRRNR